MRNYNSLTNTLPPNIFNFCRKTLIFSLNNNNSNLACWKICDLPNRDLCGKPQTQIHFLNNHNTAINDGQFKWCHDLILKTILFYFTSTSMMYLMLRDYKINRSKNLSNKVLGHYAVKKLFLEISSLGFLNE